MFVRLAQCGVLAALVLVLSPGSADAFGRRAVVTQVCCPAYCHPSYSCCYPTYTCCDLTYQWPVAPCGCGFVVSEPAVPLGGPFPTSVRGAKVGHGIVVQVDVHSGVNPSPTDVFQVTSSGTGAFKYEGWYKTDLNPGLPGGTIRYSFLLCPTKAGDTTVDVDFVMSNKTIKTVPFKFHVAP